MVWCIDMLYTMFHVQLTAVQHQLYSALCVQLSAGFLSFLRAVTMYALCYLRCSMSAAPGSTSISQREFFIDNLLVRIHLIIVMIRRTGLAPSEFDSIFQVALHLPS